MEIIKEYLGNIIKNNLDENGKLNEFATIVVMFAAISLLNSIVRSKNK